MPTSKTPAVREACLGNEADGLDMANGMRSNKNVSVHSPLGTWASRPLKAAKMAALPG